MISNVKAVTTPVMTPGSGTEIEITILYDKYLDNT